MKNILFLALCIIPLSQAQAQGEIEIYANGHKYDSLESYLASKKSATAPATPTQVSLNSQQEDYIRKEAHKLFVLSVENGVAGALQDFYETRGQSGFQMPHQISSEQLPEAIAQAVAASKDPKLLISTPGKVRIAAMSPDNSQQH